MSSRRTGVGAKRQRTPVPVESYTFDADASLMDKLIEIMEKSSSAMTSKQLQDITGASAQDLLEPLQELITLRRVEVWLVKTPSGGEEHAYKIIAEERAAKLRGLTTEDQLVLQLIEKTQGQGMWVRNLKIATRLQQTQLNKILKRLEGRKLIKPVKSITFKTRRMYMSTEFEPDKSLSGGPWYSDTELDLQFIDSIRQAVLSILNSEGPMTAAQVAESVKASGVTTQVLLPENIEQVLDTLVYDGLVDYNDSYERRSVAMLKPAQYQFLPRHQMQSRVGDHSQLGGLHPAVADFTISAGAKGAGFHTHASVASAVRQKVAADAATDLSGFRPLPDNYKRPDGGAFLPPGESGAQGRRSGAIQYDSEEEDLDEDEVEEEDEGDDDEERVTRYYSSIKKGSIPDGLNGAPCGVCPVISSCSPTGVISPNTCLYFSLWLEF